jgi:hypothetical protein
MLLYTLVDGESAPEGLVLSGADATVAELLSRAEASRSAQGRRVVLPFEAEDHVRLAEVGLRSGDLVRLGTTGEPVPEISHPEALVPVLEDAQPEPPRQRRAARLSEYEEMTQLLQWHAPYHINGDDASKQVWTDESTALRSMDWERYRSPDKLYYRTYVNAQARAERAVQTAFAFAEETGQLEAVDAERVAGLRELLAAMQYPAWGLCVLHQYTTRFALSSWIAGATEFMMFDELRHAQLYARLTLAYEEAHGGFDQGDAVWLESPRFQPLRRVIEELMCVLDWGQAILVAGLVVEPILSAGFRSLLESGSLRAGDALTGFVCQSIERDQQRHRESSEALLALVCEDVDYGEANRQVVGQWAASWLPRVQAAIDALVDGHAEAAAAAAAAAERLRAQLAACGVAIDLPVGGSVLEGAL